MGEKNRMPKPRLWVILPVYNEEAALGSWRLAELRLVLHDESFAVAAWDGRFEITGLFRFLGLRRT